MPRNDDYHETVKRALVKDGWTVIAEQVKLIAGKRRVWVDLQAANAARESVILIEIKGFEASPSDVESLAQAIGQYALYETILELRNVDLPLYLTVPEAAYLGIFSETLGLAVRNRLTLKLMVFDPETEEVVLWLP